MAEPPGRAQGLEKLNTALRTAHRWRSTFLPRLILFAHKTRQQPLCSTVAVENFRAFRKILTKFYGFLANFQQKPENVEKFPRSENNLTYIQYRREAPKLFRLLYGKLAKNRENAKQNS